LHVVNGYAVAFGAVPGTQTSRIAIASPQKIVIGTSAASLPVSLSAAVSGGEKFVQLAHEQQKAQEQAEDMQTEQVNIQTPHPQARSGGWGGAGGGGGGEGRREGERAQPSGRVAFANYENVFLLCGARNAAAFLRHILSGGSAEIVDSDSDTIQEFWLIESPEPILVAGSSLGWPWEFGIYEPSARTILKSAADNRLSPPPTVGLAIAPVQWSRDASPPEDLPGREIVMQGDGLALVRWPHCYHRRHMRWNLSKGDWI
jgi:hypothetical protein